MLHVYSYTYYIRRPTIRRDFSTFSLVSTHESAMPTSVAWKLLPEGGDLSRLEEPPMEPPVVDSALRVTLYVSSAGWFHVSLLMEPCAS